MIMLWVKSLLKSLTECLFWHFQKKEEDRGEKAGKKGSYACSVGYIGLNGSNSCKHN